MNNYETLVEEFKIACDTHCIELYDRQWDTIKALLVIIGTELDKKDKTVALLIARLSELEYQVGQIKLNLNTIV